MRSKRIFVEAIILSVFLCLATPLFAAIPPLHVDGNKIRDPDGNIVVLRGIALIDLGFLQDWQGGAINMINRLTDKTDAQASSPGWYPKIIRINVTPPDSVSGWPHPFNPGNTDLYDLLRTVVDYCATKDMYCIIDWHYVANTYEHVASTSQFWAYMAPRFANDKHVMFELFNEPINTSFGSELNNWLSVRTDMQTWINIVRAYAPNNIILVAGPSWSQAIGPAASNPLTGDNIAIVSHIYPGHWRSGNPSWYTYHITVCAAVYPILMTEWGFSQSGSPDPQDLLNGTITGYGQPLSDFREQYSIGNTAWVASYDWGPPMFWNPGSPLPSGTWGLRIGEGEMGGFTKDLMYLKRDANQPGGGDATPPAAPTGLSATTGTGIVSLNWNDNGESDLYGYDIYRSTTPASYGSRLNLVRLWSSNYTDSNVAGNTTYYYVVTATDTSWNESGDSGEVSVFVPGDMTPPAVPTGLAAVPGNGTVSLNWNDDTEPDLDGYNVYRSTTSGSGYVKQNGSLLSSSDYNDNSVINDTTYYYVVTAADTSSNESGYSIEDSATPCVPTIYNFVGITQTSPDFNAFACDVDVFPFASDPLNRNTMVEATNQQYINISTNNTTEWTTADPGSNDEIFLWIEMKINELPANISRIDFTFNGYTGGTAATTHKIYLMRAFGNWLLDGHWSQVGSDQSISPGAYASMTRSVTSSVSNFIDPTNGKIVWAVYETRSSEAMHVNYLEMAVYAGGPANNPPTVSITSPSDGAIFAQNANINIDASASDTDGSVTKVEFYEGTTKLGEDTSAPYSYTWNNVPTGLYTLTAIATDNDSNTTTSSDVNITVLGAEGTGAALCEWWTGITGTAVSDLTSDVNYPDNPSGEELLITLEGPVNWADNYGTRIRGYLNPVTTGSYTFWIASDADSELWLSTDDNPANASLRAYVPGSSQSSPVSLASGQKYYIEVLHKEGTGNDNISVSWQGPGISQQVIDGIYLSPCGLEFTNFADFAAQWNQTDCNIGNDWCYGFDFSRDGSVLLDDLGSFVENWLVGIE